MNKRIASRMSVIAPSLTLAITVAFLMKKNRWDVKYMAEKVGVTPATFRRWLKSTSQGYLSADAVVKIAWALKTTIFTVLSYNCKIVRGKEKAQIPKEK